MTCTPQVKTYYAGKDDVQYFSSPSTRIAVNSRSNISVRSKRGCQDPLAYIPDTNHIDHTPWKYIRVNFHWMNSADSSHNFSGERARKFIEGLLVSANKDLKNNNKLWLPYGNDIPVTPPRLAYRLTPLPNDPEDDGIYEHFDDELCYYVHKGKNRNLANRTVLNKYGIQQDSVLNIFIMPHHPDSVASPTYTAYGVGVALRNFIKIAGPFEMKNPDWAHRGNFNHEVGHILGLNHAWGNDGCDDTPVHKQKCWSRTKNPPCDKEASNNMMDYNALQNALSPCQIGIVHANIARENSIARKFILPTWCDLNEKHNIRIRDSVIWKGAKDIEGHLIIKNGGHLTINCRVSLPRNAAIIIEPEGILTLNNAKLHNACGHQWEGIKIQKRGNRRGQVILSESTLIENNRIPINPN